MTEAHITIFTNIAAEFFDAPIVIEVEAIDSPTAFTRCTSGRPGVHLLEVGSYSVVLYFAGLANIRHVSFFDLFFSRQHLVDVCRLGGQDFTTLIAPL
jgi:hypothetical protein